MNTSDNQSQLDDDYYYFDPLTQFIIPRVVPVFYAFVCALGVTGNLLVVIVFGCDSAQRDSTNTLIINLALCDLLFLVFCVPLTAINYALSQWPFGALACQALYYLMHVSVIASMWTIVLLTIDRFLAITFPLRSRVWRSVSNAIRACACLWLMCLLSCAPVTVLYRQVSWQFDHQPWVSCVYQGYMEHSSSSLEVLAYHLCFAIGGYVVPLSASTALNVWMIRRLQSNPFWSSSETNSVGGRSRTSEKGNNDRLTAPPAETNKLCEAGNEDALSQVVSNSKSARDAKRRSQKNRVFYMITTVSVVFGLCWLPMNVTYIVNALRYEQRSEHAPVELEQPEQPEVESADPPTNTRLMALIISQVMAYMNSALNPILYGVLSSNFRRGARKALDGIFCRRQFTRCRLGEADV